MRPCQGPVILHFDLPTGSAHLNGLIGSADFLDKKPLYDLELGCCPEDHVGTRFSIC